MGLFVAEKRNCSTGPGQGRSCNPYPHAHVHNFSIDVAEAGAIWCFLQGGGAEFGSYAIDMCARFSGWWTGCLWVTIVFDE